MKWYICGDLCVTAESRAPFETLDVSRAFGSVPALFGTADRVFVNLECAVTESDKGIMKFGPLLKAPLTTVETLKRAGFTDLCLSNNHIFDFGKQGLRDTLSAIRASGLGYTGIGENYEDSRRDLVVEAEGLRISVVDVCEHEYSYALEDRVGARPFDEFDTMYDIRKAKQTSDRVIVIYHGGKEFCRYPSPRLYRACHEMARCGADVILCQHSHIIGCYEKFEGCHILYGQGNFHFIETESGPTFAEGLIVALTIDRADTAIDFVPVRASGEGIDLAEGAQKEAILSDMAKRNDELADGSWKQRWHEFCLSVFEPYDIARRGALERENLPDERRQLFSHYLDCEAHRDVWMELFPTWHKTAEDV